MILNNEIPNSVYSKQIVCFKCDDCGFEYDRRFDASVTSYNRYGKHKCKKCSNKYKADKKRGVKRPKEVIEKARKTRIENNKKRYPKFTITCKCCQKEFIVPYGCRDRIYCGRSCQSKSIIKTDIRIISVCIICKKEFKHYGERILCSRDCMSKYFSITRIGENNPSYNSNKTVKKCFFCKKEFEYGRANLRKGQQRVFCSLFCSHQIDLKGNPQSGIIREGYPLGWYKVKKIIKARDSFECQLCGFKESIHVHHIDYDKKNIEYDNLITLCQKCHNMTHCGRTFWEIIFSGMISGSKIVKKPWGAEIHIANNNEYCLKYLIFFKDKQFSYHSHCIKKELWHCVYGKMECVLENSVVKQYLILKQGDKIELQPNVVHQLQAIKNTILVEVSSRDYMEDSYRLIKGVN